MVTVIINASFVILSLTGALESAAGNFVGKFGPEVLTWVVLGLSVAILVWLTLLVFLVRGTLTRALLRQPT